MASKVSLTRDSNESTCYILQLSCNAALANIIVYLYNANDCILRIDQTFVVTWERVIRYLATSIATLARYIPTLSPALRV